MKPLKLFIHSDQESLPILQVKEKDTPSYGTSDRKDLPPTTSPEKCDQDRQLKYPTAVYLVLGSKFFESFAANGVRSILALYLRDSLNLPESLSMTVLHIFNFFSQFCPIFGAILADSYFGNAKTIFYFLLFYALGFGGITLATLPFITASMDIVVFISLFLISVGNGNIRACITSLAAIQFKLPEQKISLQKYFSHYYFVYTMGILSSKIITPSIRGLSGNCYGMVFGFLGILFLGCWITFLIGMFFYKKEEVSRQNILVQVVGCIWYALWKYIKKENVHANWMDSSIGRYSEEFVQDVRAFLRVIKLYLPLPIYWALLAQQDSSWTFQATKLDTTIFGWSLEPDQVKAMGPLLLLMMIPFWQNVVLPLLQRTTGCQISPLFSVTLGGVAAALSFICSGILEVQINQSPPETISFAWQIPQFFLLMMGEVLLSIPGLQFSFTQAPATMKSVLTASWFVNNAIGNLIVVVITELKFTSSQSSEYFLYSFLMICGITCFTFMAGNYDIPVQGPPEPLPEKYIILTTEKSDKSASV
ncbi:solute carrier family 15 member 2 isoform X2 [Phlebotomus papatasi]|uniref:solute carrier family 15 member 2 isoform X2 n=1 Tax=Phlebotomus papatasi TaxID=29031 RepID=UPI00248392E7|nr:solute carrier family 15 member 2 isoform X2 [Phlebotomus papatasi]